MDIQEFIPKYIRKFLEDPSRKTITAEYWNELWNLLINQGDWNSEAVDALCKTLIAHKTSGDHDSRYYAIGSLDAFLRGGDTIIRREVYTIVNSNNGDGTFTYSDVNGVQIVGTLGEAGEQIFTLTKGTYYPNEERVEIIINDTLHRSQASGGVKEIDSTHVALTVPEGSSAEITIKYYERLDIVGMGLMQRSEDPPTIESYWLEVL